MIRFAALSLLIPLFLLSCSKTPEQIGDNFLKKGDNRMAYSNYQRAIETATGGPSQELREKYLSLTLVMGKERLKDDETLESVGLFQEAFKKYEDAGVSQVLRNQYAEFLAAWAESAYVKTGIMFHVIPLLTEAKKYAPQNKAIAAREDMLKSRYGKACFKRAQEAFATGKREDDGLALVEAEYFALLAVKYLDGNQASRDLLSQCRTANLLVYSAYDRALSSEEKPDPEIDRYPIYMAITKQRKGGNLVLEGVIYNLSNNPFDINCKQFTMVDKAGNRYGALLASKFEKPTLDVKMECKFTLQFPKMKAEPQKLIFKEEDREGVKYWP